MSKVNCYDLIASCPQSDLRCCLCSTRIM